MTSVPRRQPAGRNDARATSPSPAQGQTHDPALLAKQAKGAIDRGWAALQAGNRATAAEQFRRAAQLATRLEAIAFSSPGRTK
jgi:hypothetical protein